MENISCTPLLLDNEYLYFGVSGDKYKLICLSARTGKLIWDMALESPVSTSLNVHQDWLVFSTQNNELFVFKR